MTAARFALCHDGALCLEVPERPLAGLERWIPRFLDGAEATGAAEAVIRVGSGAHPAGIPAGPPTFSLDTVGAWVDGAARRARLRGGESGSAGHLRLDLRRARLTVPEGDSPDAAAELFTLLTISSALLLGRLGRTLAHAAAVTDPAGRAWLLVGDTHAGKTTTTINLVRGGWGFLSDDHVVAFGGANGEVGIEGWPRPFHVDEGWERGEVTGRRTGVEPAAFGAARWRRSAPLGGLLFPRVQADAPTRLEPLSPAAALAALIRQTPWLMTDRVAAPSVLGLLREMSHRPAYALSVGLDTYADPGLLAARLRPAADSPRPG